MSPRRSGNTTEHRGAPVDVLIVTAIKEEFDAVLAVSAGAAPGSDWQPVSGPFDGLELASRSFLAFDGQPIQFLVSRALEMGSSAASATASPLVHHYKPRCVAMCGVCAGRRSDVNLGDVIIADRLWTCDTGSKVVEGGREYFKADPFQYALSSHWLHPAQRFQPGPDAASWLANRPRSMEAQTDWLLTRLLQRERTGNEPWTPEERKLHCPDYTRIVSRLWDLGWLEAGSLSLTPAGRAYITTKHLLHPDGLPEPEAFATRVGAIATGTQVIRDPLIFDKLSERMRKVLGLEMEAAAIGAIAHLQNVRMIVMKGVMDHADPEKNDNFKAFAARASAECLIGFLRKHLDRDHPVDVTPRNGTSPRATNDQEDTLQGDESSEDTGDEIRDIARQHKWSVYPPSKPGHTAVESSPESRRRALGGRASWRYLKHYFPRPALVSEARRALDAWRPGALADDISIPVFWLDGRSGDGKSVLLLQLAEDLVRGEPDLRVVKLEPPDLPEAIRELSSHRDRLFLLIDDLHRAIGDETWRDAVRQVLEQEFAGIPILTCGPSTERHLFIDEVGPAFNVTPFRVRGSTPAELEGFATWLDRSRTIATEARGLLVEFLFELRVKESLNTFADNFRKRLEDRGGPQLVEQVREIVAVNGLDVLADQELLAAGNGIDILRMLEKPEEGHFDLRRRFPGGQPAVWFEHARIARQLFTLWSRAPIAPRLAEALLPSIRLCAGRARDLDAVIDGIARRLVNDDGSDDGSAGAVLEHLCKLLVSEPRLAAHIMQRALQRKVAGQLKTGSESLVFRAEAMCSLPQIDAAYRCGIAAQLLLIARRERLARYPEIETLTRSVLWTPENRSGVGVHIVFLASQPEANAAGWSAWPREWLRADELDPRNGHVLSWLLFPARVDRDAIDLAERWLAANPGASGTHQVLAALIRAEEGSEAILLRGIAWLETNRAAAGSHHVVASLIAVAGKQERVISLALAWLDANPASDRGSHVFAALVTAARNRADVVTRAVERINATPTAAHSHPLVVALVQAAGARSDVIATAVAWLEVNGASSGAVQVVGALLKTTGDDKDILRHVVKWLDHHISAASGHHALVLLLTKSKGAPEIIERALRWLDASEPSPSSHVLLSALVTTTSGRDDVVTRALQWIDLDGSTIRSAQLLAPLLATAGSRSDVIERASAWLDEHGDAPESARVMASLVEAAGAQDDVIERASRWLDGNDAAAGRQTVLAALASAATSPHGANARVLEVLDRFVSEIGSQSMLTRLLATTGSRDEVIERVCRWLDANGESPDDHHLLVWLLAQGGTRNGVQQRALTWLASNGTAPEAALILSSLLSAHGSRSDLVALALSWLDAHAAVPKAEQVLVALLSCAGDRPDVVQRVLDWLDAPPALHGAPHVIVALVSAASQRDEVITRALAWFDANPSAPGAHAVIATLTTEVRGRDDIVARALAWLETNRSSAGSQQVLDALFVADSERAGVVTEALAWLDANANHPSAHQILKSLLDAAGDRPVVVERTFAWLDAHPSAIGGHRVLDSLLRVTGARDDVVDRAVVWLAANPTIPGGHDLLHELLRVAGDRPDVFTVALAWLDRNPSLGTHRRVLARLVVDSKGREEAVDRALRWLDTDRAASDGAALVGALMAGAGAHPGVAARVRDWLERNQGSQAAMDARWAMIEARMLAEPHAATLRDDLGSLLAMGRPPVPLSQLLGRWIRAGGPDGPAIDFLVEWNHKQRLSGDRSLKIPIASAAARNADVVLAAARECPDIAQSLCYLISRGTQHVKGSGRAILGLRAQWPRPQEEFFWYAIIMARDLAPDAYLGSLSSWSVKNVPREVLNALAERRDLDADRRIPKDIRNAVNLMRAGFQMKRAPEAQGRTGRAVP